MAKRTKYEFGKTYYSIVEVELTDREGHQAEKHDFENWRSNERGPRYRNAIDHFNEQMPKPKTARERTILSLAKKIGYVEAMAEQKLWYDLQQLPYLENARESKAIGKAKENKKFEARYLELIGPLAKQLPGPFEGNADKPMRKTLEKEFNLKPRTINNRLIKLGLRRSIPKNKR